MNALSIRHSGTPVRLRAGPFLIACAIAFAVPASGQNLQNSSVGLPQDWSHRHLIYSNPESLEDFEASGKLDDWVREANDPRFVRAFERKEQLATTAKRTSAATAPAIKALAKKKRRPDKSEPTAHRDWSNVMGGASGVGRAGVYPAKYNFGVSTKDCVNDFVVFTTNSAGATSSGTFWTKTGTFTNAPAAGGTLTINNVPYNPNQVLILTASSSSNVGLSFLVGANATQAATNLANAIARNGGTVGVTATSLGGVVTITSITTALAAGDITVAEGLSNFTLAASVAGSGSKGQPTIFALNQLYADTVGSGGCQTATQAVPATMWAYTTGTNAVANTSPVLSLDGDQVAFVQHTGTAASLVLLKWSSSTSVGTIGAPTAPTSATPADYRTCTAPCMTVMALSGNPNDTNSSPFYDYANDVLYVGADDGTLHKFTDVFNGTPTEVVSSGTNVWPAVVSTTALTSPVFDSTTSKTFVGSARSGNAAGTGMLHAVDSTIGSGAGGITSSGQLFVNSMTGTFDSPIVDSSTGKIYVFVGDDFNNPGRSAIYQFDTGTSLATQTSPNKATVSENNSTDTATTLWSGGFDDAYYSGAGDTGFLYVCGHTKANFNPTPVRVAMSGTFGGSVAFATNDLAGGNNDCSPVSMFSNSGAQYLFVSVASGGNDGTCLGACAYMLKLLPIFDATSTSSTMAGTVQFMSISTSAPLNTTEASVATTLAASEAGTYSGMTITQGANSPAGTTFQYILRKSGANTAITCTIGAGNSTCSDATHTASFVAGDTIDVRVSRSGGSGSLTTTFRVQIDPFALTTATAGLPAPGGTGGIIVDNSLTGGGSQIYYSTRTSPGIAVQASQAGLN